MNDAKKNPFTPQRTAERAAKRMEQSDVIVTLRRLLAAVVRKHGTLDRLTLSRDEIEAVAGGAIAVEDRPDGTIVLRLKGAPRAASNLITPLKH